MAQPVRRCTVLSQRESVMFVMRTRSTWRKFLPALALAFLALNDGSSFLILPRQQYHLVGHQRCTSIQPLQERCHHILQKRVFLGLQLKLSSCNRNRLLSQDGAGQVMETHRSLVSSVLQAHSQKGMTSFSHQFCNGRRYDMISRLSIPLFMNQGSDPASGFGEKRARKKKRDDSNSSNSSKSKGNKKKIQGMYSYTTLGDRKERTSIDKTRPSRQVNAMENDERKNRPKKSPDDRNQSKVAKHTKCTLQTMKSSIKTSDENTSLKGFISEIQPTTAEHAKSDSLNDTLDENVRSGDDVMQKRVDQLEMILSHQKREIQELRREIEALTKATSTFPDILNVLRKTGLPIDAEAEVMNEGEEEKYVAANHRHSIIEHPLQRLAIQNDNMEVFGIAPKSVTDAANAAGASILAAILAGKHRMLVDVRDAELTRDPKLFVEFVELVVLPVAAGMEQLGGDEYLRNRVKIVFPTVKELMSYRRSMALAAPEVVSLSTLGFDPNDELDSLIVVIAPSPDDMANVSAMEKLILRTDHNYVEPDQRIMQPLVVLSHHMVPVDVAGLRNFTLVYHLRLLNVQYMTGDAMPEYVSTSKTSRESGGSLMNTKRTPKVEPQVVGKQRSNIGRVLANEPFDRDDEEDAALEAAMTHAHDIGVHQGVTRAMVIREYPKPWHVFVDTSPDTDADFEAAATFDVEPTPEDVNFAIVECLEGSEQEDEIVAQQMQAALEAGQLNRVSDMLCILPADVVSEDNTGAPSKVDGNNDTSDYWDDLYYDDWFSEDSV